jgi:hypothetical protein
MFSLLFIAALLIVAFVLTLRVRKGKRNLERQDEKNVRYYFLKNTYDFLLPFTFVLSLYLALVAVVSVAITSDSTSLKFLFELEKVLATIKSYFFLKLSPVQVLLCYIVLYVIGVFPVFLAKRKQIYKWLEKYYLPWTKRIYIALVLLCSFTLFGTQVGRPETDLQVRIKTIRSGYAQLQRKTQEILSEEVAFQLYTKAHDSLPPSYAKALAVPKDIQEQVASLHDYYAKSKSEYGTKTDNAESILAKSSQRNEEASRVDTELRLTDESVSANTHFTEPEAEISYRKIKEAEKAIETVKQNRPSRAITFFESQEGKKIVLQLEKIISSRLTKEMFASVTQMWPYSEPIIDVFINTLDDKLKAIILEGVDNITKRIVRSPAEAENAIREETTKVVNQTVITVPEETAAKASQAGAELDQELANIEAARVEIEKGVQQARDSQAAKPIAELHSPDETVRDNAARRLSEMGERLSEAKVKELINIMRRGSQTWTSSYREEGHHCTWYEYTPIRYYAAKALATMKSKYVNGEIVSEANRRQFDSITRKRVTDPGWI